MAAPVNSPVQGKDSAVKLVYDKRKCRAMGLCEAAAPELFEIHEYGRLEIKVEHPTEDQLAEVRAAVAACPTESLSLEED